MIAEDREERSRITSSGYLKFNPKSAEEEWSVILTHP
jgi:hypothetical protein